MKLDELYDLLEKSLNNEPVDLKEYEELLKESSFNFKITGEGFNQSLTTEVMTGLVNMQKYINQTYSLIKYDDIKKLTKDERQALQLNVKLGKGSSLVEVSANGLVSELMKMLGNMDQTHLTVVILGLVIGWVTNTGIKNYKEYRLKKAEIDKDIQTLKENNAADIKKAEEETKRHAILERAIAQNYHLENVERQTDDAKLALLKSLTNVDSVTFSNHETLTGSEISELTRTARRSSEYIRLDGDYKIEQHNFNTGKLRLCRVKDGLTFDALISQSILDDKNQTNVITEREWAQTPISLEINAKKIGDSIKDAEVMKIL